MTSEFRQMKMKNSRSRWQRSFLYQQLDDRMMQTVLNSEKEINQRIYTFPNSAIQENDKKIGYFDYISSLKSEDCNSVLKRIAESIDMDKINKLIDSTPAITELQKEFYKIILLERKDKIIDYSMELLLQQEIEQKTHENEKEITQNLLI